MPAIATACIEYPVNRAWLQRVTDAVRLKIPLATHVEPLRIVLTCLPQIQEALSASPAGTAHLDLVCAYMKRVHFYIYYRGQQCRDEGDMIASRGACRATEAASKEEVEEVSVAHSSEERHVHRDCCDALRLCGYNINLMSTRKCKLSNLSAFSVFFRRVQCKLWTVHAVWRLGVVLSVNLV